MPDRLSSGLRAQSTTVHSSALLSPAFCRCSSSASVQQFTNLNAVIVAPCAQVPPGSRGAQRCRPEPIPVAVESAADLDRLYDIVKREAGAIDVLLPRPVEVRWVEGLLFRLMKWSIALHGYLYRGICRAC